MSWDNLTKLCPLPTHLPPSKPDISVVLSSNFTIALQANRSAKSKSSTPSIQTPAIPQSSRAAQTVAELCAHFETLLSDKEALRSVLHGHKQGSVLHASPPAATALSKLIPALANPNTDVDLIAWLADLDFSHNLLQAGLPNATAARDEIAKTLRQMQTARHRLILALENEERKQRDLILPNP